MSTVKSLRLAWRYLSRTRVQHVLVPKQLWMAEATVMAPPQVEDMRRKDLYRRDTLLQKIQGETAKARALLVQRAALQEARKKVPCLSQMLVRSRWCHKTTAIPSDSVMLTFVGPILCSD